MTPFSHVPEDDGPSQPDAPPPEAGRGEGAGKQAVRWVIRLVVAFVTFLLLVPLLWFWRRRSRSSSHGSPVPCGPSAVRKNGP